MNDQIPTSDQQTVKPCIKCGAVDRYACGKCRPCQIEASKRRYKANPEPAKARSMAQRNSDKEAYSKYKKMYYEKNKNKIIAKVKAWASKNPKKVAGYVKKWDQSNPEVRAAIRHNRRAKEKGTGRLSSDIVHKLMSIQTGKCRYCEASLDKFHVDHIMPLALGGTNTDNNVQLLCPKCNLRKAAKHPLEFEREFATRATEKSHACDAN